MKKKLLTGMLVLTVLAIFSFGKTKTAIIGKINPIDGAEAIWAIGGKDSLKTAVTDGQFYFDVKPNMYKLIIDAKEPYKDVLLENLQVKQDETLDVGEIMLKQ